MNKNHRISDGLFDYIYKAITIHHHWLLYKSEHAFLQIGDIHGFISREEATAFKEQSEESLSLIYAPSILSAYQQIEGAKAISILSNPKTNTMTRQNFEFLKDNLKYVGFGEGLADKLLQQMQKGEPSFQLTFESEINKKAFAAVINFRKSDNTDMYFVNSYHATLQRSNGDIMDQAFYLNRGKGVTAKEAFNLLEGRAVYKEMENKEGQKYHAWIQLDFDKRDKNNNHEVKQYHDAYGYDLKAALEKYNMRDIKEPDLADVLMQSLKKGNVQAVAMEKDGGAVRMFVEANPQYKSVNLYDDKFQRVAKQDLQQYKVQKLELGNEKNQSQSISENSKKKNGKEIKETGGKEIKKGPHTEKRTEGLLPKKHPPGGLIEKKRTSNNKGLHL